MTISKIIKNTKNCIILNDAEKKKLHYVNEVKKMLIEYDWDWFITLTFKHPVKDKIRASKAIEKFINNLSGKAFGSRSDKRVSSFSVIEYGMFEDSFHVHMIIKDPEADIVNPERRDKFKLRDAVIESWVQASSSAGNPALASGNDEWLKKVDNVSITIDYMLKQLDPTLSADGNPVAWDQLNLNGRRVHL